MAEIWVLIENSSYSLASYMAITTYIYVTIIIFNHADDSTGLYIMYIDKVMNYTSE